MPKSRANENVDRQPRNVSATVTNYLDMTAPRRPRKRPRSKPDQQRPREHQGLIENEGLSLEEGNDVA